MASGSDSDALVTTTTASASQSSPTYGQSVNITASVSPVSATGSVEFTEGTRTLGVANLFGGQATLAVSDLAVGARLVTVNYMGDANYRSSAATVAVTVSKRAAAVALAAPASASLGGSVGLTATVEGTNPAGEVEFRDGAVVLGRVGLANAVASLNTGALTAGTHGFTAAYVGDANHNAATSPVRSTTVDKASPNASLASSNPSSSIGQSVTLTASISSVAGIAPTGTVTFRDGATDIGIVTLSGSAATLSTNTLSLGTHQIVASYSGDANYNPATSQAITQVVSKAASTTSLQVASRAFYSNQTIVASAAVVGGSPTGTVRFQDGGVDVASAPLSGGIATATIRRGAGTSSLTAIYDGDASNLGSSSSALSRVVRAGQRPGVDFNDDGRNDIGWFNSSTAQVYLQLWNGFAVTSAGAVYNTGSTQSKPVVVGDFDGDGKADVLEREMPSGVATMVLLNGLSVVAEHVVWVEPDPAWEIFAAADLDGDGKDDIVWYNASTGVVYGQLMDGPVRKASGVAHQASSPDWRLVAVGDFDGDGKADLVWRHAASGQVWMVRMDGLTSLGDAPIYQEPNLAWTIVAAADFNADGRADMVWFNAATRQVFVQLMNGFAIEGANFVYAAGGAGEWKLVETADFDGDGKADLLWYNTSTGQVWMVRMSGLSILAEQSVYQEPNLNWGTFNR